MNGPHLFTYKGADYTIFSPDPQSTAEAITRVRSEIEAYIDRNPRFKEALEPMEPADTCDSKAPLPLSIRKMVAASRETGVGPMAAVAGTIAQLAAEATSVRSDRSSSSGGECIIDNGGDIFIISSRALVVGLYIRNHPLSGKIAFSVPAEITPLAICSSSSRMGHSLSFGDCDLATVFSHDGALADAAATSACNLVRSEGDLQPTAERIQSTPGIIAVFLVKKEKIAIAGELPELVPQRDPDFISKVTHSRESEFEGE